MRRWLRVGRLLVLGSIALVLSLALIVIAINFYDPPVTAAAAAFFKPPAEVPDQDNLYLALMGLGAPEGLSLPSYARIRMAAYDAYMHDTLRRPKDTPITSFEEPRAIQPSSDLSWCKNINMPGFWEMEREASVHNNGFRNDALLQRYLGLSSFKGFSVTVQALEFEPIWETQKARCEFSAYVIGGFSSTDPEDRKVAIRALISDVAVWREVVRSDTNFLNSALASMLLTRDWQLLANGLTRVPGLAAEANVAFVNGVPWSTDANWSIASAFIEEGRSRVASLRKISDYQPAGFSDRIGQHFFKPNATINLMYQLAERFANAADGPSRGMDQRFAAANQFATERGFSIDPRMLYNPIGRLLASIAWGPQQVYALRIQEGAAFEKMTRLSFEMHLRQIQPADVPAFMTAHPDFSTHPVTGKPFTFDAATTTVSFEPVAASQYYQSPKSLSVFNVVDYMQPM